MVVASVFLSLPNDQMYNIVEAFSFLSPLIAKRRIYFNKLIYTFVFFSRHLCRSLRDQHFFISSHYGSGDIWPLDSRECIMMSVGLLENGGIYMTVTRTAATATCTSLFLFGDAVLWTLAHSSSFGGGSLFQQTRHDT